MPGDLAWGPWTTHSEGQPLYSWLSTLAPHMSPRILSQTTVLGCVCSIAVQGSGFNPWHYHNKNKTKHLCLGPILLGLLAKAARSLISLLLNRQQDYFGVSASQVLSAGTTDAHLKSLYVLSQRRLEVNVEFEGRI